MLPSTSIRFRGFDIGAWEKDPPPRSSRRRQADRHRIAHAPSRNSRRGDLLPLDGQKFQLPSGLRSGSTRVAAARKRRPPGGSDWRVSDVTDTWAQRPSKCKRCRRNWGRQAGCSPSPTRSSSTCSSRSRRTADPLRKRRSSSDKLLRCIRLRCSALPDSRRKCSCNPRWSCRSSRTSLRHSTNLRSWNYHRSHRSRQTSLDSSEHRS